MPISNTTAVDYGLLALCAEDMYRDGGPQLTPKADDRIKAAGWTVVDYLSVAEPKLFVDSQGKKQIRADRSSRIFFGFIATKGDDVIVAIRGTERAIEWLIDATAILVPHPSYPTTCKVELGFWSIYDSLSVSDMNTGAVKYHLAAEGIAAMAGEGQVIITGHSLGSAVATYLFEALCARGVKKLAACLFASPRTGDAPWCKQVDISTAKAGASYDVFNYYVDLVPHVPPRPLFQTLSGATWLYPDKVDASIRLDIGCDHHLVCYCAMLDYDETAKLPMDPALDKPLIASCVSSKAPPYNVEAEIVSAALQYAESHNKQLLQAVLSLVPWAAKPPLPSPATPALVAIDPPPLADAPPP